MDIYHFKDQRSSDQSLTVVGNLDVIVQTFAWKGVEALWRGFRISHAMAAEGWNNLLVIPCRCLFKSPTKCLRELMTKNPGSFAQLVLTKTAEKELRMTPDETLDTIEALCHQELGYQVYDYLGRSLGPLHESLIDVACRSSMIQWCNNLVDFCQYDRETTAYAVSCLDRYLSTPDGTVALLNAEQFQLAAMCALYTSAKIHERQALEPASIAKLSRGVHSTHDVERMEARMLNALKWRVNPPTALRFVHLYLDLIPNHMLDDASRQVILDLVKYQLNLALLNYPLSLNKASNLGLAALLNAIDCQEGDGSFGALVQDKIGSLLYSCTDALLLDIRFALVTEISLQSVSEPMRAVLTSHHTSLHYKHVGIQDDLGSPRVVSYGMMI